MDSNILKSINNIHPLSDEASNDLKKLFRDKELDRNEYLLQEGERAFYINILVEGIVRVYYSNDGNEYNKNFFVQNSFPTAITSLLSKSASQLSFQALTKCRLIQFSYQSFRELFIKHRSLESLMLTIMEGEWIKKEQHDIRMVTNDATTNYLIFRDEYPGLENLIPQYHIASYLGITPIQLSRIRAQQIKK